jgi:hypothetical protein
MKKLFFLTITLYFSLLSINAQIRVVTGGDVGIGTNSPHASFKATIDGHDKRALYLKSNIGAWGQASQIEVSFKNTTAWAVKYLNKDNFYVAGEGWLFARGKYFGSDSTLKQDIEPISSPLDKISLLRGVYFRYNDKECDTCSNLSDTARYLGFIAQEVEEVVPEAIKVMGDSVMAVSYTSIIPLLLEGIKEQQAAIVTLSNTVSSLESMIYELDLALYHLNSERIPGLEEDVADLRNRLYSCCGEGLMDSTESYHISGKNKKETGNNGHILFQNRPNPYMQETTIEYVLSGDARDVKIFIFDMSGKEIKKYSLPAVKQGKNILTIKGNELSAGMYIYTLVVDGTLINSRQMILSK